MKLSNPYPLRQSNFLRVGAVAAMLLCIWIYGCPSKPEPPPDDPSKPQSGKVSSPGSGDANAAEIDAVVPIGNTNNKSRRGDVVFVHGLGGHFRDTWDSTGKQHFYWPEELARQHPDLGVWSVRYDANISDLVGPTLPIQDRSKNLLPQLSLVGIGERPLVFIAHSLGGLVVKQMLRDAITLNDKDWESIAGHTKGIAFLATPHIGSDKANLLEGFFRVFLNPAGTSVTVDQLKHNSRELRDLNIWYRENASRRQINTLVLFETRAVKNAILVVDSDSSDPGITGVIPRPVSANHLDICKPRSGESFVYREVDRLIGRCLGETVDVPAKSAPPEDAKSRRSGLEIVGLSLGDVRMAECGKRNEIVITIRNISSEVHAIKSLSLKILEKWKLLPIHIAECNGGGITKSATYNVNICEDAAPCETAIDVAHFVEPNGVDQIGLLPDYAERNKRRDVEYIFRAKVGVTFDGDNKTIESEEFIFTIHNNEWYIVYYNVPYSMSDPDDRSSPRKQIDAKTYAQRPDVVQKIASNREVAARIRGLKLKTGSVVLQVLETIEAGKD